MATNASDAHVACLCHSACLDWYATAEAVAARTAVGGGGFGWSKSNSAAPLTNGGSGTTPRLQATGTGGAAGIRDPFVLANSRHQPTWKRQQQEEERAPSAGIGAQLCDALLFPKESPLVSSSTAVRNSRQKEPLIPKETSPTKMLSVYQAL